MSTDTNTPHISPVAERPAPRRRMDPMRKVALAGGVLYLITFAASLPQLKLFANVIDDPTGYISSPGFIIPIVGLVGAPIILMSDAATILGGWSQVSSIGALCALPVAAFEFSLGVWLTVKGFRRTALASLDAPSAPTRDALPVA